MHLAITDVCNSIFWSVKRLIDRYIDIHAYSIFQKWHCWSPAYLRDCCNFCHFGKLWVRIHNIAPELERKRTTGKLFSIDLIITFCWGIVDDSGKFYAGSGRFLLKRVLGMNPIHLLCGVLTCVCSGVAHYCFA
ncbi:hypothetical protein NPIL_266921 [Nephila pilipes]|uniref:Uncharacterized protein n=1 Tax=Nephila pilipes TaxID=299642 RepID=A0A8X6Q813_NEPPI|nr:hypothetical protein NPIL_266921 [Nephila pilipes]